MIIYTNHCREQLKKLIKYTLPALLIPFSEILSSSRDNHNHNRNNQNSTIINASGSKSCFNNSNIISQNIQQHPQPQYPTQCDFANRMQYSQTTNPIYMPPNLVVQQPYIQSQAVGHYPSYSTQQYRHQPQYPTYFNMPYEHQSQLVTSIRQKRLPWWIDSSNFVSTHQQALRQNQQCDQSFQGNFYKSQHTNYPRRLQYDNLQQPYQVDHRLQHTLNHVDELCYQPYSQDHKEDQQLYSKKQSISEGKIKKLVLYRQNNTVSQSQATHNAKLLLKKKQPQPKKNILNQTQKSKTLQPQPKAQNQHKKNHIAFNNIIKAVKSLRRTFFEYTGKLVYDEKNDIKPSFEVNDKMNFFYTYKVESKFKKYQKSLRDKLDSEIKEIKEFDPYLDYLYNEVLDNTDVIKAENKKFTDIVSKFESCRSMEDMPKCIEELENHIKKSTLGILYNNLGENLYSSEFKIYGNNNHIELRKLNNKYSIDPKDLLAQVQSDIDNNIFNEELRNNIDYHLIYKKAFEEKNRKNPGKFNYESLVTVDYFLQNDDTTYNIGLPHYRFNENNRHSKYLMFFHQCKIKGLFGDTLKDMEQCYSKFIELSLLGNIEEEEKEELINFVANNKKNYLKYVFSSAIKNCRKCITDGNQILPTDNNSIIGAEIALLGSYSAKKSFYRFGKKDHDEKKLI